VELRTPPACPCIVRGPTGRSGFAAVVPHLTIGHDIDRAVMSTAEDAVSARLPVSASVRVAHLFQGADASGACLSGDVVELLLLRDR
jgi:hypothetical protein